MPNTTQDYISSDLTDMSTAADWFINTKPIFNKQQINWGWKYIEKQIDVWHCHLDSLEYEKPEHSEWHCPILANYEIWHQERPINLEYKLVPLTNSYALYEETKAMKHCVVTYDDQCMQGTAQIFSIREIANDERYATAELRNYGGRWQLAQLKGKHNLDLMHHMDNSANESIASPINAAIVWYEAKSQPLYPSSQLGTVRLSHD